MTKVLYILSFTAMFAWVCLTNCRLDRLERESRDRKVNISVRGVGVHAETNVFQHPDYPIEHQRLDVVNTNTTGVFTGTWLGNYGFSRVPEDTNILIRPNRPEISEPYHVAIKP